MMAKIETRTTLEYSVLDILRRIDQEIDFARGYLQLSILLELGKNSEGLTIRDLARRLSERNKSVADALRKMVQKNIVTKTKNGGDYEIYTLTDHGKVLYENLSKILGNNLETPQAYYRKKVVTPQEFVLELIKKDYIVDAIIAIASSKKGALNINEIAEAMGLSTQRAQAYLEVFCGRDAPLRIFRRIDMKLHNVEQNNIVSPFKKLMSMLRNHGKAYYMLTDDGLTIFHKLPFYTKYATSRTGKILRKLFGNLHPRLVAKKLFRLIAVINISATITALAMLGVHSLVALSLLLASIIFTTTMLILYIATYNL